MGLTSHPVEMTQHFGFAALQPAPTGGSSPDGGCSGPPDSRPSSERAPTLRARIGVGGEILVRDMTLASHLIEMT
jgi:hypothetical protein